MDYTQHPVYQGIASAVAVNPTFRFTSLIEYLDGYLKQLKTFIDTPEERANIKAAVMLAYKTFIAPRVGNLTVFEMLVGAAVDQLLVSLGS